MKKNCLVSLVPGGRLCEVKPYDPGIKCKSYCPDTNEIGTCEVTGTIVNRSDCMARLNDRGPWVDSCNELAYMQEAD